MITKLSYVLYLYNKMKRLLIVTDMVTDIDYSPLS